MKSIILFCIVSLNLYSQNSRSIDGTIVDAFEINDSIIFNPGPITPTLYQTNQIKCLITKNKFSIIGNFDYPQMYYISLFKESSTIPYRKEICFIDATTNKLIISKSISDMISNNALTDEYYNHYIPFIIKNEDMSFYKFRYTKSEKYHLKIKSYVKENKDSYVALWNIAERISNQAYQPIFDEILNLYSIEIKNSTLWKAIYRDLNAIRIHIGKVFPIDIILQDTSKKKVTLILPKAKFTLIDFWFSRCKPCLNQMPKLKELYQKFSPLRFDIIGISTDRTSDISLWKKRIEENTIPWSNYLDENAVEATREKITEFPSNYLLDSNGMVLFKNISLQNLEEFLNQNNQ